ncbi:multicopper oxidase domain-containing protein [Nonomuraea sediminis]|uniref:multicopper oxidase domain-containing protein n=1 Tax=Nonomuraea sediminis TaxID=2835864 RepID=UPI001BDC2D8E|nr:multicopper oxidase domain-containing protein [Nonomuraea sediminis]
MYRADYFEQLLNFESTLSLVVLLPWWWAAHAAYRLPYRRRPHVGARVLLGVLALATLALVVRAVLSGMLAGFGWEFVADRVVVVAPVTLLPAVLAGWWTVPRLWRLRSRGLPEEETRRAAADPRLAWPVQVTAVGAAIGFVFGFLLPIPSPFTGEVLLALVVFGLSATLLWVRLVRRGRTELRRPRWSVRWLRRVLAGTVILAATAGCTVLSAQSSRLPQVMKMHGPQEGAAHGSAHSSASVFAAGSAPAVKDTVSVTSLTEPDTGPPDRRFTLEAREQRVKLASGAVVDAWAFNGSVPGPEIRVRVGELVEITLVNHLTSANVSVHWHGMHVPNAADGVPGVTQDAVPPGGRFVYRFRVRPGDVGTHWYHSHQVAAEQVERGLFGPLIVEPAGGLQETGVVDRTVMMHTWQSQGKQHRAFGLADQLERLAVPAGRKVRLRLVDTAPTPRFISIDGTSFQVTAEDGNPVNQPSALSHVRLPLGGGGRYDVEFTMPAGPVRITESEAPQAGLLISPDGSGDVTPTRNAPEFDISAYGKPTATPFGPKSHFDRTFTFMFDNRPGFYDGAFTFLWTINGQVFPNIPTPVVRKGELVKMRFINRSHLDHPMHLHGHSMLLLSRNGRPVTGSPVWLDTVDVQQGEILEVAFLADNPGVWMDHCHNLLHARAGQVMHLMYDNVESPFESGSSTPNNPL